MGRISSIFGPFWLPFWLLFVTPGPLKKQLKVCNYRQFSGFDPSRENLFSIVFLRHLQNQPKIAQIPPKSGFGALLGQLTEACLGIKIDKMAVQDEKKFKKGVSGVKVVFRRGGRWQGGVCVGRTISIDLGKKKEFFNKELDTHATHRKRWGGGS